MSGTRFLLLDTNTLLLWFVGLVDPQLITTTKRTATFEVEDYDLLLTIVGRFRHFATTPHILAEVSNLFGNSRATFLSSFASHFELLVEFQVPASGVVADPQFARLGLTDVGISHLAKHQDLVVLTTDAALHVHLLGTGVDALNFNHLRSNRLIPDHL